MEFEGSLGCKVEAALRKVALGNTGSRGKLNAGTLERWARRCWRVALAFNPVDRGLGASWMFQDVGDVRWKRAKTVFTAEGR